MREREAEVGMEQPIELNAQGMAQDSLDDAVPQVAPEQTVAVMEPDAPPLDLQRQHLGVCHEPQLARQEGPEPEVVVPAEVVDFDSGATQVAQHRQRFEWPSRDRRPILEPEVEQIAVDDERVSQVRDLVDEAMEKRADRGGSLSKMSVGDDEDA